MSTGQFGREADLLHPLTTTHWTQCHTWRSVIPTHCAVLHDRVAILAVGWPGDELHISSTDLQSWTTSTLPYRWMSLTTYKSKFVLVGGYHLSTDEVTNILLTSDTDLQWKETLPPMPTRRMDTSSVSSRSPEVLVVAGGRNSDYSNLDVVEVLLGDRWTTVRPLPKRCYRMHSVFHDGNLYFIGGDGQGYDVYTCSCSSLMSSCEESTNSTTTDTPLWSQFKAPGDFTTAVSYSSYLVSIDRYSVIRAYYNVTQSWMKTTSTGYNKHQKQYTPYLCAAVLPTGELVYAHEYEGVYKVKIIMSSFDPDSRFLPDVLSRLEAVMAVHIVSVLANIHQQFTTSSGVTLQPRLDKWGHEIPLPDPQTAPGQYVEEVMLQWSTGHSPRPATWRELLHVLQENKLLELKQQIDTFMKGETRYLEAYHYFISNKESLALLFLKFLFVGPPRLGKSTTLHRLMGKIVDLKSEGEEDTKHPSTGTVESKSVLVRSVSNTAAVITQSEWSAVENVEDEARMLLYNLVDTLTSKKNIAAASSNVDVQMHSLSTTSVEETTLSQPTSQSMIETQQIVQQLTPALPTTPTSRPPQISPSISNVPEVIALFQKAMRSEYWKDVKHMFKAYLRVEDTGGQPELMDMRPALTIGPGLYLLFINLQNDLDHHYKLTYYNKSGNSTPSVESIYNVKEMLLSSLASIWCSCANSSKNVFPKDESIIPGVSSILKASKSKAYIVGTHKDKVTDHQIKELNEQLKKVVESTGFSDIVEFFSEEELIVAIDNMAGGADEVKKVQTLLEKCMDRCFRELKVPVVWLLLSLVLRRRETRTISLTECMHLSEALHTGSYETEVALLFLHHHAGVLMYFPNIPELKDLVIIDIQIVYDSVTILILQAMNIDWVGREKAQKFKETGKFTIEQLIAITSKVSSDFIPIHKLVVLLEYLHIIARISPHQQTSSFKEEEVTYIMPCVLNSATKKELDCISQKPHEVCPIMIRFKCGFAPIGMFPALTTSLINNTLFEVIEEGIKKNVVQFHYGVHRILVTVLCRSMYYEFIISQILVQLETHKECSALRKDIEKTVDRVCSRMNYGSLMDYEFAFECPEHIDSGQNHLCIIKREELSPVFMNCLQNIKNKKPVKLRDQHNLWFGKAIPHQEVSGEHDEELVSLQCSTTMTSCVQYEHLFSPSLRANTSQIPCESIITKLSS